MSNIKNVFDISGRAMAAQLIRLNTVASNLANAGNIAGSKEEAYKAIKPVFETDMPSGESVSIKINVSLSGSSTTTW